MFEQNDAYVKQAQQFLNDLLDTATFGTLSARSFLRGVAPDDVLERAVHSLACHYDTDDKYQQLRGADPEATLGEIAAECKPLLGHQLTDADHNPRMDLHEAGGDNDHAAESVTAVLREMGHRITKGEVARFMDARAGLPWAYHLVRSLPPLQKTAER